MFVECVQENYGVGMNDSGRRVRRHYTVPIARGVEDALMAHQQSVPGTRQRPPCLSPTPGLSTDGGQHTKIAGALGLS